MNHASYLRALLRPVVTMPEVCAALGIPYPTAVVRLRRLPDDLKPPSFRAVGSEMMLLDNAIAWLDRAEVQAWLRTGGRG